MTKISRFDPIDYLVHRKYPIDNDLFARPIDTLEFDRPSKEEIVCRNKAMEDYRKELSSKTPAEIEELVKAEKERERQEAEEERRRFYNLPSARADFDHYFKAACWTLEECVALSFGKDPNQVNWTTMKPFKSNSLLARKYEKLRDLTLRAHHVDQLSHRVLPGDYLTWAKEHEIPIDEELANRAATVSIPLKSWRDLYNEERAQTAALIKKHNQHVEELTETLQKAQSEIEALRQHQPARQVNLQENKSEKSLSTKERESLLKLVGGMAVRGYGFNPDRRRNEATGEIRDDLEALGLGMNDDTIRKYLNQSADLIPRENLENLKR